MPYAVGQEVVYIGPDFRNNPTALSYGLTAPRPGAHYHIREPRHFGPEMIPQGSPHPPGWLYLLAEIRNPIMPHMGIRMEALHVWHGWLRPVEKRKTDISALRALLNPLNHKELEET